MATYVLMLKEFEDDQKVIYCFGPNRDHLGRMQMLKPSGDYLQLDPVPGISSNFYFMQTVLKLIHILESGEPFPDQTNYAS